MGGVFFVYVIYLHLTPTCTRSLMKILSYTKYG
ncbi:Uncharacterised protein [Niallia circulans]|nr:Uncharacterised protein [Niallia circulans]